ncbi:GNAT family N-acetyltransferase [Bacillus sp. 1P10SD]|uniref:GNAT family N-acetyltransferase n=1 Tax=Bacillus sp. 1P10SD TaxID=3132265 RepID=UPI0039A6B931
MTTNLFTGKYIKLTAPREEDTSIMLEWMEDAEYLRNVDTEIAMPKSKEQLLEEGKIGHNEYSFRLRTISEEELIGFVSIHSIEWNNRTGTLAIGIGNKSHRNKGYGSDALQLILNYGFNELNLDRISLEVIEYNVGGVRAYEKAGFQHEGRKRSAVYRDGNRYDSILMAILRSEWKFN